MAMVNSKLYRKYVITDKNGQMFLYVEVLKALYGPLDRAILFYKNIVKYLEYFCTQ